MDELEEIIARNEAEAEEGAVEVETPPDPEPDPEPEPEPDHEQRVAAAEQAIDHAERDKKLNAEQTRHINALKKAYGDDFKRRQECALCAGEGYVEPGQEVLELLAALGEQAATALGANGPVLESPDNYLQCVTCNGKGSVATKADNDHNRAIPCKKCQGRGYFDTDDPVHRGQLGLPPPPIEQISFPVLAPLPQPVSVGNGPPTGPPGDWQGPGAVGNDAYGRWPGHPRFGIDPANGGW